jgi:diguanylate cyclase
MSASPDRPVTGTPSEVRTPSADHTAPTPAVAATPGDSEHARHEARVLGFVILTCYLIDAALLAGYAALGTIGLALPVVYAATGLAVFTTVRGLMAWAGHVDLASSRSVLMQTLVALVLVDGCAWLAPQIALPMVLTSVSVVASSALRLAPATLIGLVLANALVLSAIVFRADAPPAFPAAGLGEQVVTGLFLVWTLLKIASINAVGNQLRSQLDRSHAELGRALAEVQRLAEVDDLTSLPNRRSILRRLAEARERAARQGTPLGVGMIDIDFFKRINDQHGHPAGDAVLRAVAALLRGSLRGGDLVGRVGGEEFLVLLDSPFDPERLRALGERSRQRIESHDWDSVVPGLRVSASIGLTLGQPGEPVQAWLERADRALYQAKALGRNRIELEVESAGAVAGQDAGPGVDAGVEANPPMPATAAPLDEAARSQTVVRSAAAAV